MRGLTIWQPWATLLALGIKHYETRDWSTRYRGPVAIHAGARPPDADSLFIFASDLADTELPLGKIIAIADLDTVIDTDTLLRMATFDLSQLPYGNFAPGRFAWLFRNIRPVHPMSARGKPGLWPLHENQEISLIYV